MGKPQRVNRGQERILEGHRLVPTSPYYEPHPAYESVMLRRDMIDACEGVGTRRNSSPDRASAKRR